MKDQSVASGNQDGFTVGIDGRITCCRDWVVIEMGKVL